MVHCLVLKHQTNEGMENQMSAEERLIKKANIAKVREIDFAQLFGENINNLIKLLGITRKIPAQAGTVLKVLKVTGSLQSGNVAEGEVIPLSQFATTYEAIGEMKLNKWRKATSAEAIMKGGFDQAVNQTNAKLIREIQKGIRTSFLGYLENGTGSASGTTLQSALADAWGQLQVKFEDDDVQAVYILNPLDVSAYLGTASITTQTAFGFTYIENFLGLGTVILSSGVTQGTFYATVSQNIVMYYIDARGADGLGEAFDFTTDAETGFVGVHEDSNYQRLQSETVAICGVDIFAEQIDGVIVGTINANPI